MKLSKLEIWNFRSIEHVSLDISDLTSVIGENNAGKSSILRAIELFYEESIRPVTEEYFFFKDQTKPIEVALTFDSLTDEEKNQKYIKHWIFNESVCIKSKYSANPFLKKY